MRGPVASDALPSRAEQLAQPLGLPHCNGMKIVEWRSTSAFADETSPSPEALKVIDGACQQALARYPEFLREKGLGPSKRTAGTFPSMSLLPGNVLLDGKDPRSLNDLPGRFGAVTKRCCYWGLYVDGLDHLFVRNDPLTRDKEGKLVPNPRFLRTFQHELAHVLNARLGVLDLIGNQRSKDEELAEDYVTFLGFDFPTESSSDDLAMRKIP